MSPKIAIENIWSGLWSYFISFNSNVLFSKTVIVSIIFRNNFPQLQTLWPVNLHRVEQVTLNGKELSRLIHILHADEAAVYGEICRENFLRLWFSILLSDVRYFHTTHCPRSENKTLLSNSSVLTSIDRMYSIDSCFVSLNFHLWNVANIHRLRDKLNLTKINCAESLDYLSHTPISNQKYC